LWDLAARDDSLWEIEEDKKLGRAVTCTIKKAKGAKWDFLLKSEDIEPDLTVSCTAHFAHRCPRQVLRRIAPPGHGALLHRHCDRR